jgi:hypothetical protein
MKPKGSGYDSRSHMYIDCAECQRGGNGDRSCSAGARHRKIHKGMCFSGQLLDKFSFEEGEENNDK